MKVVETIAEMRDLNLDDAGFVPTMGALHEGHLALFRLARSKHKTAVASIFVNPTQFGPKEDFKQYPRTIDQDLERSESSGIDVVFLPQTEEIYRGGPTTIDVGRLGTIWEGAIRPGHFNGVALVVNKLFNIMQPHRAYFGEKDFQQCAVIRQMVRDLDMPVELEIMPTVRESDGLAMSSRNRYLSPEERSMAPMLYEQLSETRQTLLENEHSNSIIESAVGFATQRLESLGFVVDYFELVDEVTLETRFTLASKCRLIAAARLGSTRLIDNLSVT